MVNLGIRDTIDHVKIKQPIIKNNNEPTKRNLRILLLADLMAVISGFLLSAIV